MGRSSIRRIDIAILVVAVAGYLIRHVLSSLTWADLFWDFDVYQRAVADAVLGADPYRQDAGFPFLYHPVVLYAFMVLDRLAGLINAYIGLCAAAVLIFLWGCKSVRLSGFRVFPLEDASLGDKAIALLVVFSICSNQAAIFTGNITLYLHLALIGSTLLYLQERSQWRQLLMLAIFFCTLLVKPYFLIYALPLLLIDRFSFRAIVRVAASGLAAAAVYLLFWVFFNAHTKLFIEALNAVMSAGNDLSDSSLGLLLRLMPMELALKIHIVIAVVLAVLVIFLRQISAATPGSKDNDGMLFLLAYALMTLCSPRMKDYDLTAAFIGLYLYLSCQGVFGRSIVLLSLLIVHMPLYVTLYYGRMNTPQIFSALNVWNMVGLLLPVAIFFGWKAWCAGSNKRALIAAG